MKVLITGKNSYVGRAAALRLTEAGHEVEELDMIGNAWKEKDFSGFDCVFHVAGIAHDVKGKQNEGLYMAVNRDLAVETAEKAKNSGVKQFIFMSSMLIYNGCKEKNIDSGIAPCAKGVYAQSKLQADEKIREMSDENFKVAVLRPPMIFGKDCKGNFPRLVSLALKTPLFPKIENKRSMLYIENLSEFVRLAVENRVEGVFFPQNPQYFATYAIVSTAAAAKGKKLRLTKLFNWLVFLLMPFSKSMKKVFGSLTYDKSLSDTFEGKYVVADNAESLKRSIS